MKTALPALVIVIAVLVRGRTRPGSDRALAARSHGAALSYNTRTLQGAARELTHTYLSYSSKPRITA